MGSRSLPTIGPSWLSDLRTPAPFEPRFWGHPPAGDVAEPERDERSASDPWLHSVTAELFDQEVDIGGGSLVIVADYELRWRDRVQPVNVREALITPETAMALGQALLTVHDRMDFLVPGTDDDSAIEEEGFELEGWLCYVDRHARSDRHDLRRGGVSGLPILTDGRCIFSTSRIAFIASGGQARTWFVADQARADEAQRRHAWTLAHTSRRGARRPACKRSSGRGGES